MYKGTASVERRKVNPLHRHKRGPTTIMQFNLFDGNSKNQGVATLAVLLTTGVVWGLLDRYPDTRPDEDPGPQCKALQNLEMRRSKVKWTATIPCPGSFLISPSAGQNPSAEGTGERSRTLEGIKGAFPKSNVEI